VSNDAVTGGYSWEGQPNTVWLNDGQGNFTDSGQLLGGSRSRTVACDYLDNDDFLDCFVANRQENKIWLSDGYSNFFDSGQLIGTDKSRGVALDDLDGDGDLDAFVA
jgi:hypothetical protein